MGDIEAHLFCAFNDGGGRCSTGDQAVDLMGNAFLERSRRIDDLERVERTTAGAAHTFAQHALKAVEKAGGDVSKVEWEKVEAVAIRESIMQHRQDPKKVLAAIVKHSPGMVDQARQEKAREFISTWSGKEISRPKMSNEREGPSIG